MRKLLFFTVAAVLLYSCGNSNRPPQGRNKSESKDTTVVSEPLPVKPVINVYIEGSASIDGYAKGISDFKEVLGNLLVKLKYYYDEESLHIFWIYNDKKENLQVEEVTDAKKNLVDFVSRLDIELKKLARGNNTDLNNIFREIVQKRTNNSTISILFSDYIYSIGRGGVIDMINNGKNLTMDAFLSKSKKEPFNFSTTIFRLQSEFNGWYFPYTGDMYRYTLNGNRPYYICVFANQNILDDFNKNIKPELESKVGYEDKYVLSAESSKDIYYSVLQSTFCEGRFKPLRGASSSNYIHGIEDVNLPRGIQQLTLAIAVDFSKVQLQADSNYIANPKNYEVTSNNFEVVKIMPVVKNEINPIDWNTIQNGNTTHIIVLKAKSPAVSDVSFVLKKQIPQWVVEKNTEDDTKAISLGDKTFGLRYWVEGIAEAYKTIYPNDKNYFECNISIKK
jgi:hypothetical protein